MNQCVSEDIFSVKVDFKKLCLGATVGATRDQGATGIKGQTEGCEQTTDETGSRKDERFQRPTARIITKGKVIKSDVWDYVYRTGCVSIDLKNTGYKETGLGATREHSIIDQRKLV